MSKTEKQKDLKDVIWCGNALEVIRQWPDGVKASIGGDIRRLQRGEIPRDWRPFPGLVTNAFELRDQDRSGAYRAVYVTMVKGKVIVLHCFKKTSAKTEQSDVSLANMRLKRWLADLRDKQS